MKINGYILIIFGFLMASLTAVVVEESVVWTFFVPAMAIGIIGVVIVRVYNHRHHTCEDKITGRLADIETSIASIAANISLLCGETASMDPYHVRNKIDELFTEDIIKFVDARQAIAQVYGLQEYADAMSYFASAERAINRAWSASTDGYVNEVNTSLQKAGEYFGVVNDRITKLKTEHKTI